MGDVNAGAAVIKDQVVTALKDKVLKALLALADVTGINAAISAVQSIYEAVVFAIDKAKELKEFVQTLLQGVENLINGDAQGLTTVVVTGLKKVLGLVLPFVLTQVGLGRVPKKVDESIQGVRKDVLKLLNKVLDGLLGVGKQLLGLGNAQEVSDEDNNRLTKKVPSQDKKVQVWLQKDGKTTVVKVQASPTRNLEEVLQCMLASAPGSLKSEIQTDLNQVQATQNRGQSLAVEADQPVPMGKTGTTTGGDAPAKKRQQIQTKDLVAEANILGKPEYACMLNICALAGPGGKAGAKNPSGTCIDIGSEVLFKWERANLGVSRVGRRLKGEGMVPCRAYDPDQLRLLRLELEYGDGNGVEAQLLRNVDWTAQNHAVEGSVLWLELPEIGLSGWAKVRAVDGCPEIEEGDGPLVTGWFKHRSGKVYDLVIEGEAKSVGITGTHPVWSVDRQDWVPAAELREGERLLAEDGSTPRVRSLSLRAGSEPVYNIEVDGDHCYRVGDQGILVHNASSGECGKRFQDMASWTERAATMRSEVVHIHQGFPVGIPDINFRNLKTTAVAIIAYPDCSWECVYSCSMNPATEVQTRATNHGYRLIRGTSGHAEQRIIANLPAGATLLAIAPCRPPCTDENTNRADGTCTNDILQQGRAQGFAVMVFAPVGGVNACT